VLPGANPAQLRAGRNASPAIIHHLTVELGLNKPVYTQFYVYMKNIILHFNFGYSYYSSASVLSLMKSRLPATISLAVGASIIWLGTGVLVGVISAIKRGTLMDRGAMGIALFFVSMPVFWFGLVLLFLFANDIGRFKIFPGAGSYVGLTTNPVDWFTSLILPWIVLAGTSAAVYSRLLRGSLLEVMGEDYIRTARAKGLSRRQVLIRHTLRNSLIPIVSLWGLDFASVIGGGAILTETVYNLHGVGQLAAQAIGKLDIITVMVVVMLGAFAVVLIAAVIDVVYAFLDPRIRLA
jgi:peptide/nickel transport system permease protein